MPAQAGWSYFLRRIKRRLHLAWADGESSFGTAGPFVRDSVIGRIREKAYEAYARYQPRYYAGKVSFVTTDTKTFFPADPAPVWKHLVADLEVEVVHGDHLNILTTEFESLAALLTKYVEQADGQLVW